MSEHTQRSNQAGERPGLTACFFAKISRGMATSPSRPPPEERAAEIINSMPSSSNLVTKTGSVILGTGLVATAISQELYVVNEETVIAVGFFILISAIYKVRHFRLRGLLEAGWLTQWGTVGS